MKRPSYRIASYCALSGLAAILLTAIPLPAKAAHTIYWRNQYRFTPETRYLHPFLKMTHDATGAPIALCDLGREVNNFPQNYIWTYGVGILKRDSDGAFQWAKSITIDFNNHIGGSSVEVDPMGNVVVSGFFRGRINFGQGPADSAAVRSGFIAKYDSAGELAWNRVLIGTEACDVVGLGADADGSIVTLGTFSGTLDLGQGPITSAGANDIFLARYNSDGSLRWARRFGDALDQESVAVEVDGAGNIVIVGTFAGSFDFDGEYLVNAGGDDAFIARLTPTGDRVWTRSFGTAAAENAFSLALSPEGAPVLSVRLGAAVDIGGGAPVTGDHFVCYSNTGAYRWNRLGLAGPNQLDVGTNGFFYAFAAFTLRVFDASGQDVMSERLSEPPYYPYALAVDPHDDLLVGYMVYTGERDPGEMNDVGLSKIGFGAPHIVSLVDVPNDNGRALNMRVRRSNFEAPVTPTVFRYDVFRANAATWDLVTSFSADGSAEYQLVVPTAADSNAVSGPHESTFFVRAVTTEIGVYFDSATRSASSVDNRIPAPPFNVEFVNRRLSWSGGLETDFAHFLVFGSLVGVFDGSAEQIMQTPLHSFDEPFSDYTHYYVVSVDLSGNQSTPGHALGADNLGPRPPTSLDYNADALTWHAPTNLDLDHYRVYGSMNSSFAQPKTLLTETTATTLNVVAWPFRYYFVTALDHSSNEGNWARTSDDVPPTAPNNVVLAAGSLTWDASTDPGTVHYVVYGSTSGQDRTDIGQPASPRLNVAAYAYPYFLVSAVDWNDNESAATSVADADAPGVPHNVTFRDNRIAWEAPRAVDVDHYTIYGSEHDAFDQPKTLILETTETFYVVGKEAFAYYYVTATDQWGNEGQAARAKTPAVTFTLAIEAFPNPFNPETTIRYDIPRRGRAVVAVYDARGVLIATLVDTDREAGSFEVQWNGTDDVGAPVGSGVYFARLDLGGDVKTRKLVLLK